VKIDAEKQQMTVIATKDMWPNESLVPANATIRYYAEREVAKFVVPFDCAVYDQNHRSLFSVAVRLSPRSYSF
jgi:hypothetical protein